MTVTAADIVNQAVQLVGGNNNQAPVTGSSPDFDGTPVGVAAGTVYDLCVQTVTRQFGWDFARAIQELTLTGNTAALGFLYEYIFPTNAVELLQVIPPVADIDPNNPLPINWMVSNALGGSTQATGSIAFLLNPSPGATITLNGRVITFVANPNGWPNVTNNYSINIALDLGGTLFFLTQALQVGTTYLADPVLNVATYDAPASALLVTYTVPGTLGNGYTLAASVATPSGAHLTGGTTSQQKAISTDVVDASAVLLTQPPESTWDANFQQAVVRLLASFLAMSISSKPESAKTSLDQAMAFEKAGETRTDT